MNRPLWVVPEINGGIRTYTESLLPAFGSEVEVVWDLPDDQLLSKEPRIVHIQHEFGLFGSKLPGFYRFPRWIRSLKKKHPDLKWIATAHNVLDLDYRFPTEGKGFGAIPRVLANLFLIRFLRKLWTQKTWGELDGVIAHSRFQVEAIRRSGCRNVVVIPHYVPRIVPLSPAPTGDSNVVLFGYFTPDKGQDIAIRAWAKLGPTAPKLILAGGLRRPQDSAYLDECKALIKKFNLENRIEITGYVPNEKLDALYQSAGMVIAPFRYTSGSGSLATAFARGAAILASDLPLNLEIDERVPGCLAFFNTESPESLAEKVEEFSGSPEKLSLLRKSALAYAEKYSPEKVAALHREFYRRIESRDTP